MPVKEAKKENEAKNGIKNKPIRKAKKEKLTEAPISQPGYEAILRKKITRKEDIGGNFEIPCNIRGLKHMNALVDQGSDVNATPLSTYMKLTDERPAETDIRLSLASHLYIYPLGISGDVLVEEEKIKLHQEKEIEFDRWRNRNFKNERPALVKIEDEVDDEGEVTSREMGKSGLANTKRRTIWFALLLELEIDQNENHILRPSTVAIAKKLKELIQKDELTIDDLKGAGLEKLKQQYKNDVELEYHVDKLKIVVLTKAQWNSSEGDVSKPRSFKSHMSKSTNPHPCFYNNDFYYLVNLSTGEKYTTSLTMHLASRYHIQGIEDMIPDRRSKEGLDKKEYTLSYADLPRLNLNDIEDMYLLKVQDKLHHL
ncbi:hypothetical protein Tco_0318986 [Tanacetum coccineum]